MIANHCERFQQQERLIEHTPAVWKDVSAHPPVTIPVETDQHPVIFGYAVTGVFLERADFGDFPTGSKVFVSFEGAGAVGDGDCNSEFPASS